MSLEVRDDIIEVPETNHESVNIDVTTKVKEPEVKTAVPNTVDMSQILPQTTSLDQVSAKEYLQLNVFPKLEVALNNVSYHFLYIAVTETFWLSCWRRSRRMANSKSM